MKISPKNEIKEEKKINNLIYTNSQNKSQESLIKKIIKKKEEKEKDKEKIKEKKNIKIILDNNIYYYYKENSTIFDYYELYNKNKEQLPLNEAE